FKNISSPKKNVAQYAIHLWNNANNNLVENNLIEDCDRGIGFGMRLNSSSQNIAYSNLGGVIRNNTIIHSDNDNPFSDTGIGLEDSALTLIENNKIWLGHNYPNAIEYRFSSTTGVIIHGNITNKKISSRNGGVADVFDNITDADLETILAEHLFTGK
ncbi:MAG: right-handed parallel beta-helix repeat-containing protein, partial [Gammaproteobacteria bacterium]|nr:right-handed parallel beta-helix repeat-containing protein [Gammaproteobacteria bacterium]